MREQTEQHAKYGVILRSKEKRLRAGERLDPKWKYDAKDLVAKGGLLYRATAEIRGGRRVSGTVRYQLWVPPGMREWVKLSCHDHLISGAHLGRDKTFAKITERYWWEGVYADVVEWCKSCGTCAARKGGARYLYQCGHGSLCPSMFWDR